MAQNQTAAEVRTGTAQGAVLRPGRAADPVPDKAALAANQNTQQDSASVSKSVSRGDAGSGVKEEPGKGEEQADKEPDVGAESPEQTKPMLAESRQRKLRLMLRQCDRVLLMDFELLAMNDWPDNFSVATARRSRDLWVFSALVAAVVFLSGLTGIVPAWVAGGGFGAFIIIVLLGIPVVRRVYTSAPSYLDLLLKRQRLMRDARKHAEHLEGKEGLIWQCARMADYNPVLKNTRFSNLLRLSEQKALPRALSRREHVRLYLIYLLEAEKAYSRVQAAFLEGNQEAIDEGWQAAVAQPEDRT
ncbi:hypothetical protein [Marinobacter xiaoshiensis]|uniref:Uncharacterized protein n=1 Tax=Marinobacter xiaoshiensis TaxID=3073652 RepID=A0ABU2HFV1_9GAMM|nr:hypothetical protein [Marinobacter sp. F60267]MDS1309613.1 hypothetical protein [Marinobacter sp. F60267]